MDRPGAELAGLIALAGILDLAAGTGLAYVAGFDRMRAALLHPDLTWLTVMAATLCVSFAGYYCAYRGVYRAEDGYRLPCRRLLRRESIVRAGALGGVEQSALAFIGCAAAIVALCLRLHAPPAGGTLPWAIIPVPAALLVLWAAGRYTPRLRGRPGWRARILVLLDSVLLVRQLLLRPRRALTLWLPMPFSLAALPALRRIGSQAARRAAEPGEDVRVAA
jgi:hypothetical protein